jgi:predicted DNA-binding transcriptional regulator AlpA
MRDEAGEVTDVREIMQEKAARHIAGGMSKSGWYRYESGIKPSAGVFPRAFRLPGMPTRKFYRLADIRAWIAAQLEAAK